MQRYLLQKVKVKVKRKRSPFITLGIWVLVSLSWQIPLYNYFNQQVAQVLNPVKKKQTQQTLQKDYKFAIIPDKIVNPKMSYQERYVAYQSREGGNFFLYDLKEKKRIWTQTLYPQGKFLGYQWLPDRNSILLYVSGRGVNPSQPSAFAVGIHMLELDSQPGQVQNRFADSLPYSFRSAQITNIQFSTPKNLLYFCVQEQNQSRLFQIDIMKHLRQVSLPGEKVQRVVLSPNDGTAYIQSSLWGKNRIFSLKDQKKTTLSEQKNKWLLGYAKDQVYLGNEQAGRIVAIDTMSNSSASSSNLKTKHYWQGHVPFKNDSKIIINGFDGFVVDNHSLYPLTSKQTVFKLTSNSGLIPGNNFAWNYQVQASGTQLEKVV